MTKVLVTLEFNEQDLGEKWMNIDNLKLLLYSEKFSTKKSLLKIVSYVELDD